jgi:hypothetical protein
MTQTRQAKSADSMPLSHPSTHLSSPASRIEICHLNPTNEPEHISQSHGFLGSTSFSATIQHGDLTGQSEHQTVQEALVSGYIDGMSNSAHFQLGLKTVSQLPNEQACHALLEWYMDQRRFRFLRHR